MLYPPKERTHIRDSWRSLMRWSKVRLHAVVQGAQCVGLGCHEKRRERLRVRGRRPP